MEAPPEPRVHSLVLKLHPALSLTSPESFNHLGRSSHLHALALATDARTAHTSGEK